MQSVKVENECDFPWFFNTVVTSEIFIKPSPFASAYNIHSFAMVIGCPCGDQEDFEDKMLP